MVHQDFPQSELYSRGELSFHTCSKEGQVKFDACAVRGSVDVVLTVFSRNNIAAQLNQVQSQTRRVSRVWVVQNEGHIDVNQVVEEWKQTAVTPDFSVEVIQFSSNSRYHGRFHVAYFMSNAEYVSIWDDDVAVGSDWVRHCIEISQANGDAVIGANGRSIVELLNSAPGNFARQVEFDGKNDFVGHTWTLKRQLLKKKFAESPVTYVTGEDIQLAYSLQKMGVGSIKATQKDEASVRDTPFTSDEHASFKKGNLQEVRQWLFCKLITKGFRPLHCTNCDLRTAHKCVSFFEARNLSHK